MRVLSGKQKGREGGLFVDRFTAVFQVLYMFEIVIRFIYSYIKLIFRLSDHDASAFCPNALLYKSLIPKA